MLGFRSAPPLQFRAAALLRLRKGVEAKCLILSEMRKVLAPKMDASIFSKMLIISEMSSTARLVQRRSALASKKPWAPVPS